jgi:hypothetical protein
VRTPWADLPPELHTALAELTGPVRVAHDVPSGAGSDVAAWLYLDDPDTSGVFVKGARKDSEAWAPLQREIAVGPYLPMCAPARLWFVEAAGWVLLGSQMIHAAHAVYTTGSPDLEPVAAALAMLPAAEGPESLPPAWDRWGYWCDPADEPLFTGGHLVHADPAASNFLIVEGRAWLVDWGWAVRGAAWIDTILWGGRLVIDGGQAPTAAAELVRGLPGFALSTPRGRAVLARAEARAITELADAGDEEMAGQALGAHAWAEYWEQYGG